MSDDGSLGRASQLDKYRLTIFGWLCDCVRDEATEHTFRLRGHWLERRFIILVSAEPRSWIRNHDNDDTRLACSQYGESPRLNR